MGACSGGRLPRFPSQLPICGICLACVWVSVPGRRGYNTAATGRKLRMQSQQQPGKSGSRPLHAHFAEWSLTCSTTGYVAAICQSSSRSVNGHSVTSPALSALSHLLSRHDCGDGQGGGRLPFMSGELVAMAHTADGQNAQSGAQTGRRHPLGGASSASPNGWRSLGRANTPSDTPASTLCITPTPVAIPHVVLSGDVGAGEGEPYELPPRANVRPPVQQVCI